MRPPESWNTARVTLVIVLATSAAFFLAWLLGFSEWLQVWGGFIPARLTYGDQGLGFAPFWLTPLTSALLHVNLIHLVFNMVILAFCGRQVEPIIGSFSLAILYLLGAYAAAAAQYLAGPTSTNVMVGASGAISAIIGAYALLIGRNKVKVRSPRLATALNALWLFAAWVVLNLLMGIAIGGGALSLTGQGMEIAVAAHIGGFGLGLLLGYPLYAFHWRKA